MIDTSGLPLVNCANTKVAVTMPTIRNGITNRRRTMTRSTALALPPGYCLVISASGRLQQAL